MDDSEVSFEPMDVDLSSNSVSAMDVSYVESNFECSPIIIKKEKEDVTDKCLNIKPLTISNLIENHAQNNGKQMISRLFVCIIVVFFAIVTYQISYFKCSENLNTSLYRKTFASKIYGQDAAMEGLLKALESKGTNKIISLFGGTGVGKTYTTSFMLENILQYNNVYHYTMPGFTQTSSDLMFGLIYCDWSIIVVDDITKDDIIIVKDHVQELVTKSIRYSKSLTIILLYNCDTMDEQFYRKCDDNFLYKLKESLTNIDAHKYFIKFESLREEHLRKCIESEFSDRIFSESDISHIMKNFNVTIDGCKGVYQKMKYLSII